MTRQIAVGLNAVIVSVRDDEPRVLTVGESPGPHDTEVSPTGGTELPALPSGRLDPERDRTLELGLRDWVRRQTGRDLGYVEQLYTFGDQDRDPRERAGGPRMLSVAYLALTQDLPADAAGGRWMSCYGFLPWEDWRADRPPVLDAIGRALAAWARKTRSPGERKRRAERMEICFGLGGAGWDGYRVLERYELLYGAGLTAETWSDRGENPPKSAPLFGKPMAYDHRRILATGLARLRGKLRYRPLVFELIEEQFTLAQLQRVVEALSGLRLHKQNFRRLVETGGLVEKTGRIDPRTGGRPAELFRFRREVLRERRAPGVGALSPLKF
ncbi:MAG: NUDIX hydrolase [Gammaproteobacteria bacterium]